MMVSSAGLLIIDRAAPIAAAFGAPAVLGLMVAVFNGLGRLLFGSLIDRFDRSITLYINSATLLVAGFSLYFGAVWHSAPLIFAGLTLTGMSYGGLPSMNAYIGNKTFGPTFYPMNISIIMFNMLPSSFIGPMISSLLFMRSGGVYNSNFIMIIGFAVITFAFNKAMDKFA